jgi:hypothetical protein
MRIEMAAATAADNKKIAIEKLSFKIDVEPDGLVDPWRLGLTSFNFCSYTVTHFCRVTHFVSLKEEI